jgi:putative heme-binding domain-containing protein
VGVVGEATEEAAALVEAYRAMLTDEVLAAADPVQGRDVFARVCQQCHVLFGVGGQVGPEITGSNRRDLEYLLMTILDPNAVIGKDYQATNVHLHDGRVLTGLVTGETANSFSLVSENDTVVVATSDIELRRLSEVSTMPEGLLTALSDEQAADLVAYLQSERQVPLPATPERLAGFFDGASLAGWSGDPAVWSLEAGEIVGRTDGLQHNSFLVSQLELGDFRFTCEVLLVHDRGNSGIQFRSTVDSSGDVSGYQADIGPGWWGKLYEEHGRGLLWERSGETHVQAGRWNRYEIIAEGHHLATFLNGEPCVDLEDPDGVLRGVFALQVHSGGPTEVRFRGFELELR